MKVRSELAIFHVVYLKLELFIPNKSMFRIRLVVELLYLRRFDRFILYIYIKSNNYSENKSIKFLEKEKKNFPLKVYKVYISI